LSCKIERNNLKKLANILLFATGLPVSPLESSVNVDGNDVGYLTEDFLFVDCTGKSSSELKKEE
jgi:hypothetical protein